MHPAGVLLFARCTGTHGAMLYGSPPRFDARTAFALTGSDADYNAAIAADPAANAYQAGYAAGYGAGYELTPTTRTALRGSGVARPSR